MVRQLFFNRLEAVFPPLPFWLIGVIKEILQII